MSHFLLFLCMAHGLLLKIRHFKNSHLPQSLYSGCTQGKTLANQPGVTLRTFQACAGPGLVCVPFSQFLCSHGTFICPDFPKDLTLAYSYTLVFCNLLLQVFIGLVTFRTIFTSQTCCFLGCPCSETWAMSGCLNSDLGPTRPISQASCSLWFVEGDWESGDHLPLCVKMPWHLLPFKRWHCLDLVRHLVTADLWFISTVPIMLF